MAIPYVKQTWTDGSGGATPVSAARLGVIEQGVYDSHRMPTARVYHNIAQTLTTAVSLNLAFNTERFDTDTIHDTLTNNTRLTCKTAGVYEIGGSAEFAANATGVRSLQILLNGATAIVEQDITSTGAVVHRMSVSTVYQLAVNDYVELRATQSSGGNLNVNSTGNHSPEFWMARIST